MAKNLHKCITSLKASQLPVPANIEVRLYTNKSEPTLTSYPTMYMYVKMYTGNRGAKEVQILIGLCNYTLITCFNG